MKKLFAFLGLVLFTCAVVKAQGEKPLLMQGPTLNASHIVFAYGGRTLERWSRGGHRAAIDEWRRTKIKSALLA